MEEVEASNLPAAREGWVEQTPAGLGFWGRLIRGACRLIYRREWEAIAGEDWPSTIMGLPVTDRFSAKQGRSTGRVVLTTPATGEAPVRRLVVYLKRHYRLPWRDRLLSLIHPSGGWSPAMQEAAHLEWARGQGIPVPRVAAAGEFIGPGLRLQSFLAVEELTGMIPLHEAIPLASEKLAPDDFRRWKAGLIGEIARITRILHDRRHFHKDLYLCHFFIREDDFSRMENWRGRVHLIDLHRLGRHTWTRRIWQIKDLAQLLFSSEIAGVDDRDRLRFWSAYLGGSREGIREKWLRSLIMFKWRRYRRHNQRLAMLAESAGTVEDPLSRTKGTNQAA